MSRLEAKFTASFGRDLKRIAKRKNRNLGELEKVLELVLENSQESLNELRQRQRMRTFSGKWAGRIECHVANTGDWLLIWSTDERFAYFERTETHDELFR